MFETFDSTYLIYNHLTSNYKVVITYIQILLFWNFLFLSLHVNEEKTVWFKMIFNENSTL